MLLWHLLTTHYGLLLLEWTYAFLFICFSCVLLFFVFFFFSNLTRYVLRSLECPQGSFPFLCYVFYIFLLFGIFVWLPESHMLRFSGMHKTFKPDSVSSYFFILFSFTYCLIYFTGCGCSTKNYRNKIYFNIVRCHKIRK